MSQQSTLQFQVANPLRQLTGLAHQISLPHEFAPMRFPSFPALDRTALMGFNTPFTFTVEPTGNNRVMLSRQAAYPLWCDVSTSGSDTYSIVLNLPAAAGQIPAPYRFSEYFIGGHPVSTTIPGITGVTVSAAVNFPILGSDSSTGIESPFLYCPEGSTLSIVVSNGVPASGDIFFTGNVLKWEAPGETRVHSSLSKQIVSGNRGALIYQGAMPQGWYCVTELTAGDPLSAPTMTITVSEAAMVYTPSPTNAGSLVGTPSTNKRNFFPAIIPTEFTTSTLPWSSTRTTAAAALFTNVTQVLNKGGTVRCGRIPPQVYNPFSAGVNNVYRFIIPNLHPAEKAFLPLETGAYTYCPPSTDLTDFYDYAINFTNSTAVPCYRLDNTSLVNCLNFESTGTVTETLAVNLDWHLEFRTTSALFQIGMSTLTLETMHQAQLGLSTVGFFFSNKDHKTTLGAIKSGIVKYGKMALPYAVDFATGLPGPVGIASRAARRIGNYMFSPAPDSKMKPTSGKASGITAEPKASRKKVKVGKKKAKASRRK